MIHLSASIFAPPPHAASTNEVALFLLLHSLFSQQQQEFIINNNLGAGGGGRTLPAFAAVPRRYRHSLSLSLPVLTVYGTDSGLHYSGQQDRKDLYLAFAMRRMDALTQKNIPFSISTLFFISGTVRIEERVREGEPMNWHPIRRS